MPTEPKNGKIKLIYYLIALIIAILAWTTQNVLANQKSVDDMQNQRLDRLTELIENNAQQTAALIAQNKLVDPIKMNATLQDISGRVSRIEHIVTPQ